MKALFLFVAVMVVVVSGQDECLRACPMNYMPVCATYTKTYSNECTMKADACSMAKQGFHLLSNSDAMCTCERACPFSLFPVCANDGNTYDNECIMKAAACKVNKFLEVKTTGPCPSK